MYPTNPPSVEYALTPLGQSLPVAIRPLTEWAAAHHQALSEAALETAFAAVLSD